MPLSIGENMNYLLIWLQNDKQEPDARGGQPLKGLY